MKSELIDMLKAYGPEFFLSPPFSAFAWEIAGLLTEKNRIIAKKVQVQAEEDALNQRCRQLRDDLVEKLKTSWENCGDG